MKTRFLSDPELERLLRDNPHLDANPDKFCPTCHKTGTYIWKGELHNCDCSTQLMLHLHYLAAGIGTTYQRLDWPDFQGEDTIVEQVAKYGQKHREFVSQGVGLFFPGEIGTGKTMVATLTLKEFVKLGYTCYATTFANTIEMFTAGWKSREEQRWFQDKFVGSEVVLLDDVGRELRNKSRLSETTFDNILRTRVQYGRPTYITTNLTPEELEEGYGAGVLSLLKENSIYWHFKGGDFRPKANTRKLAEIANGESRPIV